MQKTMAVEEGRIGEIRRLHNEILDSLKMSLEKAIRIGELLTEQKGTLKHGEFGIWVKENLPFTNRTAENYMRAYRESDRLKNETVSDLSSAYRLLIEHKPSEGKPFMVGLEKKVEYTDKIKRMIFYADCEWIYYQINRTDEQIYNDLEEIQEWREQRMGVPKSLTPELFSIMKATVEEHTRLCCVSHELSDELDELPDDWFYRDWETLIYDISSEWWEGSSDRGGTVSRLNPARTDAARRTLRQGCGQRRIAARRS
jgi:hypothetical protein